MGEQPVVTKERFTKRLIDLCLRSGLSGLPRDEVDQHILLKSAVLTFGEAGPFTEPEINEKLQYWQMQVSRIKGLDQATMRRRLVDTGYLMRSKDGSEYRLAPAEAHAHLFEAAIDQVDVAEAIRQAREEIEARRQAYAKK